MDAGSVKTKPQTTTRLAHSWRRRRIQSHSQPECERSRFSPFPLGFLQTNKKPYLLIKKENESQKKKEENKAATKVVWGSRAKESKETSKQTRKKRRFRTREKTPNPLEIPRHCPSRRRRMGSHWILFSFFSGDLSDLPRTVVLQAPPPFTARLSFNDAVWRHGGPTQQEISQQRCCTCTLYANHCLLDRKYRICSCSCSCYPCWKDLL